MTSRLWLLRAGLALLLLALFIGSLVFGALYRRHRPPPLRPQLMVAFLAVGAGDCTLIRTPNGHAMLVDAGPADAAPLITQALRRQGVRALDLLVLAAPTPSSIGGVPKLLASGLSVAQVWESPSRDTDAVVQAALAPLRRRHIPCQVVQSGDTFTQDGARLTAIWPDGATEQKGVSALVCGLEYGNERFVLAGSASPNEVSALVANVGSGLDCDVLEVPSGGMDGAVTPELLRRATPSIAVISCASSLPPGQLTLHRLEAAGAAVWRTDERGAITVFTDGRVSPNITAAHL